MVQSNQASRWPFNHLKVYYVTHTPPPHPGPRLLDGSFLPWDQVPYTAHEPALLPL